MRCDAKKHSEAVYLLAQWLVCSVNVFPSAVIVSGKYRAVLGGADALISWLWMCHLHDMWK